MKNDESSHTVTHSPGLWEFMIQGISELDMAPFCLLMVNVLCLNYILTNPSDTCEYNWFIKSVIKGIRRRPGNNSACSGRCKSVLWSESSCHLPTQVWGWPRCTWKSIMHHTAKFLLNHWEWEESSACGAKLHQKKRAFWNDLNIARKGHHLFAVRLDKKTGLFYYAATE